MCSQQCEEAAPRRPGATRPRRSRDSGLSFSSRGTFPVEGAGKGIAIEGERESRPDVEAAGRRGEECEYSTAQRRSDLWWCGCVMDKSNVSQARAVKRDLKSLLSAVDRPP